MKRVWKRVIDMLTQPKRFGLTKTDHVHRLWRRWMIPVILIVGIAVGLTSYSHLSAWTTNPPVLVSGNVITSVALNRLYDDIVVGTDQGVEEYGIRDDDLEWSEAPFQGGSYNNYVRKVVSVENTHTSYILLGAGYSRISAYDLNSHDWTNLTLQMLEHEQSNIKDIVADQSGLRLFAVGCTGLAIHSFSSGITDILYQRDGLLSNETRLVCSVSDWLVIGCLDGVSVMSKTTRNFTNFVLTYGNQNVTPTSLAAKSDLSRIYVGTSKGLFVLTASNQTLAAVPEASLGLPPLPSLEISALALNPLETHLFIGTTAGVSWYDVIDDQYGGSLTGRLHYDSIRVRCLAIYEEARRTKLYVGAEVGLFWIDVASLEPGGRLWSSFSLSLPESGSLAISIFAFLFAFAVFVQERTTAARMGDINALYHLRRARELLNEAWPPGHSLELDHLDLQAVRQARLRIAGIIKVTEKRRDDCVSGLMDTISTTSSRYRKNTYELAVRLANLDIYHIDQYRFLKADYYNPGAEWSLRQFMGLPCGNQEPEAHLGVSEIHIMIGDMINRMETVYFDEPIERTILGTGSRHESANG